MNSTLLSALALAIILPVAALAQGTSVGFGGGGHNTSAQVEIAADSLSIDQATGRATLLGNVMIVQDTLRLTANQVTVDYADQEGRRTIQSLSAEGDVLIVAGQDAAEGQAAIYTIGSGEITMTGDVLLTQGDNAMAGERLVVNLGTGAGTVSGRVRTVLQVSE